MLISCLRDHIHSPDRKRLTSSLLGLRNAMLNATVSPNSLQVVLFSFQDAVSCFRVNTDFIGDYIAVSCRLSDNFEWTIALLTVMFNYLLCM